MYSVYSVVRGTWVLGTGGTTSLVESGTDNAVQENVAFVMAGLEWKGCVVLELRMRSVCLDDNDFAWLMMVMAKIIVGKLGCWTCFILDQRDGLGRMSRQCSAIWAS